MKLITVLPLALEVLSSVSTDAKIAVGLWRALEVADTVDAFVQLQPFDVDSVSDSRRSHRQAIYEAMTTYQDDIACRITYHRRRRAGRHVRVVLDQQRALLHQCDQGPARRTCRVPRRGVHPPTIGCPNTHVRHASIDVAPANGESTRLGPHNMGTGVNAQHEALKDNYRSYKGWFDSTPVDTKGVGTHMMGTIVGQHGIGVAWRAVDCVQSSRRTSEPP
ncbi:Aste57867_1591 [Aphanomyces stellatus]|uniref:subtilisin n=1 Tax=Aphanomyces stellatus TaxID=120398 RepID=A0A485K6M5_9STRA|nr:hypothetical protein As57867_001590 [Aphanomyces stellatus]VFT78804.1 Aste57867_1591 [Aphanomyces stellatus]